MISNGSVHDPLWSRGSDLIPGAMLAAREVNALVNGSFSIELSTLWVDNCNIEETLLQISQKLFYSMTAVLGVVGLSCDNVNDAVTNLVGRKEIGLIQLLGSHISNSELQYTQLKRFSVLPKWETHIDTVFDFMNALNWSRIGMVIGKELLNVAQAEAFESRLKDRRDFELLARVQLEEQIQPLLDHLRNSTVKILVAFLSPDEVSFLLCHASNNSLVWPEYAWILPDLSVDEMYQCNGETINKAMDNVIFLHTKLDPSDNEIVLVSNQTYDNYLKKLETNSFNPFTNVLYDMVWAFGLALNNFLKQFNETVASDYVGALNKNFTANIEMNLLVNNFSGASGDFNFRADKELNKPIEILQLQNGSIILIGKKEAGLNTSLTDEFHQILPKPRDTLDIVYEFIPIPVSATLTAATLLCVLITTIMLAMFFYCWNEPEIRASSRTLSLCIFVGCYLIFIASLAHTISSSIKVGPSLCVIVLIGATIGMDLILGTMIAKTLRIVYIFTNFRRTGKMWSDMYLLGMILVIVSVKSIIVIVWNTVDFYHIIDTKELLTNSEGLPYYNIYQSCHSNNIETWLFLEFVYSGILGLALTVLAYKTRKIKRDNYKDTKKINIFIVSLFTWCTVFLALWGIFRFVGTRSASTILASIGFPTVPIFCLALLIFPKIVPGIKRHFPSRVVDKIRTNSISKDTEVTSL